MAYEIGDRVVVNLKGMVILGVTDLAGQTEALGTVVDKPGGVLYNVRLDDPLPPAVESLNFVGGGRLRPIAS